MKQCLLIDDDHDDQEIFLMCIKNMGDRINCKALDDSIEAITMLESGIDYTPDYIFIDVNMPKVNGMECLRILKANERLRDTKIFMYSTTAVASALSESKKLGAEDFIIKPVKISELREKLSAIFNIDSLPTK